MRSYLGRPPRHTRRLQRRARCNIPSSSRVLTVAAIAARHVNIILLAQSQIYSDLKIMKLLKNSGFMTLSKQNLINTVRLSSRHNFKVRNHVQKVCAAKNVMKFALM